MKGVRKIWRWFPAMVVLGFGVFFGNPPTSEGQSAAIEPKADRILKEMSDYLGGLEQFRVQIGAKGAVRQSGGAIDTPARQTAS
jgi:hypothetical protein